jgi:hypothetical protein
MRFQVAVDPAVVVIQAPTQELNPTFDPRAIARAYEEDPASASAEYGAQFRTDVESFVSQLVVGECVISGRVELPPSKDIDYLAFVDPSGGSGTDSFTLAIGHRSSRGDQPVPVIDCIRETRPPLSPEDTVADYAAVLKTYGVREVVGDRYGGEWPRESFKRHGIEYVIAPKPKSDLYRDALALLNSRRIELLDNPRLLSQLVGLERRTARGGRDSIDHAPGQHDDVANVVCGLAVLATADEPENFLVW